MFHDRTGLKNEKKKTQIAKRSHAQTFMSDSCQDSQRKYTILKGTILLKSASVLLKRLLEIFNSQIIKPST